MKKILWTLFILALAIALVYLFLGGLVESLLVKGVETYGSKASRTEVFVGGADLSLFDGRGSLKDLAVANPKGFQEENALTLETVDIDMDPASVLSGHVIINSLTVHSPSLFLEQKGSENNLQILLDNIKGKNKSANSGKSQSNGVELEIKRLSLLQGRVNVRLAREMSTVGLPDIRIEDIGTADNGVSPARVAERIMQALMKEVDEMALKKFLNPDSKTLSRIKKELQENSGELEKELEKKLGKNTEEIKKELQDKGKKLKSLFKSQ